MIRNLGAAAAGGLLLALSFPTWGLFFTAWAAFIPLFFAVQSDSRLHAAVLYGGTFQAAFSIFDLIWIHKALVVYGHIHWFLAAIVFLCLVAVLSLFGAAFGAALAYGWNNGMPFYVTAPLLWTAVEYAKTYLFTGFPWDLVGYSQAPLQTFLQVVDITGIYGVSFLVVAVNTAVWELLQSLLIGRSLRRAVLIYCAAACCAAYLYGSLRLEQVQRRQSAFPTFSVGILQGNIPQEMKWERSAMERSFAAYERLAVEAKEKGAKLIIWPETSVPALVAAKEREWRQVLRISETVGVPMLVGAPSYKENDGKTSYYNSAFLIAEGMLRFRYDKIHLVPFGEYMPLDWLLPLGSGIAVLEADYSPGKTMTVMKLPEGPALSVLICYEAIFPAMSRMAIAKGAEILVNIVNDGWFAGTAAPYQHLSMAGVRSIENRAPLVRATNTGISAIFDAAGTMIASIPWDTCGVLVSDVSAGTPLWSFYREYGDIFALICVTLSLSTILWAAKPAK
uniref:Apolipoprotein N-acyltransferase n=1 Tax=Desulfomonile tiedjei TaxID=2358 RepID=A0A7C4ASX8_9BACT